MQPAVLLDLVFELTRRPAGIAERKDALAGPLPRAIALRMSSVAVRQMPSSIGSVEFSMKKSARVQHEAAPGLHRAALEHLDVAGARRQLDALGRRDDFELHQQVGKVDVAGRLVDDDAHGAFGGMRADIDHARAKSARRPSPAWRSASARRDSRAPVGLPVDLRGSFMIERLPDRSAFANELAAEKFNHPPCILKRAIVAKSPRCPRLVQLLLTMNSVAKRVRSRLDRAPWKSLAVKFARSGRLRPRCAGCGLPARAADASPWVDDTAARRCA